jgi:putative photosynthetic complex assembly protein
MSALHAHQQVIPRPVAWMAGMLVTLSLLGAGLARYTGYSATSLPEAPLLGAEPVVLHVSGRDHLQVQGSEGVLMDFGPGEGGFLRGVHRALGRTRLQAGVDLQAPYLIQRWGDGRVSLHDPQTDSHIEMMAFGEDNAALIKDVWFAAVKASDPGQERSRK